MVSQKFKLQSKFTPSIAQEKAIEQIIKNINNNLKHQTLLGVTGSGKTFTMANVINKINRPTLILSHNKTLAAQLYNEFKSFFPDNAVEYFISYYDYYQPEAYIPRRDIYIEKETSISEEIERFRNSATQSILTRKDVIIVASVSCIYGIGDPEDYNAMSVEIKIGKNLPIDKLIARLIDMQYEKTDFDFEIGTFRVRGDIIDINIASDKKAIRIEYFGDEIEKISVLNPLTGEIQKELENYQIFPAKLFVTPYEKIKKVAKIIKQDLEKEVKDFQKQGKFLEAERLKQRTLYDLEMLLETGYVSGIENYSRYFQSREIGSPPSTLLDYFDENWIMFIDESHITIPQIRGMYNGDRARKETLVNYGFRMKSALDNRPLKFEEFNRKLNQVIYVSATPNEYELNLSKQYAKKIKAKSTKPIVEQLIRPTGLLDPIVDIRPSEEKYIKQLKNELKKHNLTFVPFFNSNKYIGTQIDDLITEIKKTIKKTQRVLITTLTKRMAEDLTEYLSKINVKVQYIHSDLNALERVEVLKKLRLGKIDVVVGINLLREGLDLPEVSLVIILDADKEGFLRSTTTLIQTMGRASRHKEGKVIMYANEITNSIKQAIIETKRRREIQERYNKKYNIKPKSIKKAIRENLTSKEKQKTYDKITPIEEKLKLYKMLSKSEKQKLKKEIEKQMVLYADMMEFEKAIELRDILKKLN